MEQTNESMNNSEEVLRGNLIKGFVQVRLIAECSDGLPDATKDEEAYLFVSRYSYLPAAAEGVVEFFREQAIDFSTDVWFEHGSTPVKR